MGRAPCCEKVGLKKGRWASEEDELLINYIKTHGEGSWRALPKKAGLLRCGKSCRLRWINYLREDLKRGNITQEEDQTIIKLQASLGNRWSAIAAALPGRTDNEIKNYWNAHLIKKITNLEGADDQRKRKRVDSNEQEAAKRRKARKVRSEDDDYSKGGDKGLEEVTKKRRKKDSRRELQKQKEEDEKGKSSNNIAPKKGEVVVEEEEEEEAAITLTTSTITVEEVLQFVDEEVPVPEPAGDDEVGLDRGFELMRAGLEEEINSDIKEVDIIGEGFWPPTEHEEKESGGNIIDVRDVKTTDININDNNNRDDDGDDKNNRNDDRDDGNSSPGPWPEEEDGIRNLFKWEGLEDMPWELIGDTWHSIGEGNGESSDSPSTVIDGHDPFEEDLESWLFSDIV